MPGACQGAGGDRAASLALLFDELITSRAWKSLSLPYTGAMNAPGNNDPSNSQPAAGEHAPTEPPQPTSAGDPGPAPAPAPMSQPPHAASWQAGQQGMPPESMQGMPPQGMPPQGMPPQGMPPQGMPPQGMPPQGMPPQGMPPQGMPPQGMPPQGMPPQGMPPQGMPPQGPPPYAQAPYGQPRPRKGGRIVIILVVIALILGSLGLWWMIKRGGSQGASSPETGLELVNERINSADYSGLVELISPEERQYYSSLFMQAAIMAEKDKADGDKPGGDLGTAEENMAEFGEIFSAHVSFTSDLQHLKTYELNDQMRALAATGTIKMDIDDTDAFTDDVIDFLIEHESDLGQSDGTVSQYLEPLRSEMKASLRESEGDREVTFTAEEPLVLSFVEESGGWYITTGESVAFSSDYDSLVTAVESGRKLEIPKLEKGFPNPTEASAQMLENLANSTADDLLAYLPKVERRFLSTLLYLDGEGEADDTTLEGAVDFSGIETTTVEVSDHFAITPITAFSMSLPAYVSGENMKISLSDGKLLISQCAEPIDTFGLLGEPNYLLALGTIKDEEGWHVSIGGTVVHMTSALGQLGPQMIGLYSIIQQIDTCTGGSLNDF